MIINEDWYADSQLVELAKVAETVKMLPGLFIEIGCWEGKSTIRIANTIYPAILHAVDSWRGNINEDSNHPTVKILQARDVFSTFKLNIQTDTQGNVKIFQIDCFEYLANVEEPIVFCHIDASHNYADVKRTIEMLLPHVVIGGILCGDDYNRGVMEAVKELLPDHGSILNFWYWKKLV